jgi:hypothetical protein
MLYAVTYPNRAGRLILYDATPRVDAEFAAAAQIAMQRSRGAAWYSDATAAFSAQPTHRRRGHPAPGADRAPLLRRLERPQRRLRRRDRPLARPAPRR